MKTLSAVKEFFAAFPLIAVALVLLVALGASEWLVVIAFFVLGFFPAILLAPFRHVLGGGNKHFAMAFLSGVVVLAVVIIVARL